MWLIRYLLLRPLSLIYGVITSLRNLLFDYGLKKSVSFPFPVICVGNITVGGTGKTPHVEYIAGLLSKIMSTAVVSRGYMRSGKGFRIVNQTDNADITGDEPLQIARRLPEVRVAVDADRVNGIRKVSAMMPPSEAIVLDDAFQHRYVRAGLNILLTDYGRLMTRDYLMPYGRLRESRHGAKRADIIIVTKVPEELNAEQRDIISKEISPLPHQSLFFTSLEYGELTPAFNTGERVSTRRITPETGILLVTGIANPDPLLSYLRGKSNNIRHIAFRDHHRFTDLDISNISKAWHSLEQKDKMIVTTEKDSVRLKDFSNFALPLKNELFYIPIRVRFIDDGDKFIKIITDYARKNTGDC